MSRATQIRIATARCVVCGNENAPGRKTCSKECQYSSQRIAKGVAGRMLSRDRKQEAKRMHRMRLKDNRTCIVCGASVSGRLTCSMDCRVTAMSGGQVLLSRPCVVCGRAFTPRASKDAGRYCDAFCQAESRRRGVALMIGRRGKCKSCGKYFIGTNGQVYCGSVCAGSAVAAYCNNCGERLTWHVNCKACGYRNAEPRVIYTLACIDCGTEVTAIAKRTKRCESCRRIEFRRQKKISNKRREAIKRNAPVVESVDPYAIYDRDGWICQICRKQVSKRADRNGPEGPSIDHIKPLARGGEHSYRNLQLAHRKCNSGKRDLCVGSQLRLL